MNDDMAGEARKDCARCGLPVFDKHAVIIDGDRYCEEPCAPAHFAELDEDNPNVETTHGTHGD